VAYLRGRVGLMPSQVKVYERSRVASAQAVDNDTVRLAVDGHRVIAHHAVIATQIPISGEGSFSTKAHAFAHPVAAVPLPDGVTVTGMFKSVGSPSHSFRTAMRDGGVYLVAAGPEFTPGVADAQAGAVDDLLGFLRHHFGVAKPSHLWINEDFRSIDGAAFVGPATSATPNLQVATGFSAWGLTQGAVAGDIMAANIMGVAHPAAALFNATRVKAMAGGGSFLSEKTKSGARMLKDRLPGHGADSSGDIPLGAAGVMSRGGDKLAVRRNADGSLHVMSALCTHMGCVVGWNAVDRTWDCPCHRSRFDADGTVLSGPATEPLASRDPVAGDDPS
jgi:Rieske Fe-S protein